MATANKTSKNTSKGERRSSMKTGSTTAQKMMNILDAAIAGKKPKWSPDGKPAVEYQSISMIAEALQDNKKQRRKQSSK